MGENADGGDRDDDESAAAPSDDSPADDETVDDRGSPDERDDGEETAEDADTHDASTADPESDDESPAAGADEPAADEADASAEDATDEGTASESEEGGTPPEERPSQEPDLTTSLPSADEWLEEHGGAEDAPGMDMDAGDGVVDDGEAADDATEAGEPDDATEAGEPVDATEADEPDDDRWSQVGESISEDAIGRGKTLDEQGYELDPADERAGGDDDANVDGDEKGDEDDDAEEGIALDATDPNALADDARKRREAATAEDDHDEDVASAEPPVSTSDPGKNAPAGMGKPTPAGGGGGTATGGGSGGATTSFPDFDEEMAPDDEEQPLAEHIEEMTHRFLIVVLVMGLVASVALLWSDDMINFLWYSFLGPDDGTCPGPQCPLEWRPHVYHPLSLLLARLKVAALVGFVAGLPVAVYQTYRFMRPGLYPHERRYYLAAVPTSLVLAVGGVAFAYLIVLPSLFIYFSTYSTQAAELAFALSDTFDLMVMMLGFFALIFQIPLLVMLAIMMGVVTRRWLEQRRIYFWTGFAGVAFIFSPDPTGMAPLIVAITMVALFEGTLLLLRWTERSVALFSAKSLEANRPYAWVLAGLTGYVVSDLPVPEGYYDQLPSVVTETLANYGYTALTPAFIAIGIVAVFELIGWIARRVGAGQGVRAGLRVRLAFIRARPAVWLLAIVVGYVGSPDPVILDVFRDVNVAPPVAVGVAFGLIVAYEALRLVLSYVRPE